MPFNIECSKIRVAACAKEVALGVAMGAPPVVAKMAKIRFVVASGSAIGAFDLLCTGSCPEASESDFKEISDGCIPERCEPEVVTRTREGSGADILQLSVGFSIIGVF